MKKNLLYVLIFSICYNWAAAQELVIENYLGISCLKHRVSQNETFYQIAQRYFVRPSTLSMVNGIEDAENVQSKFNLYIPLTETNFYKSKGLDDSKFTFKPVYYEVLAIMKLDEVGEQFFVTVADLKEWNANVLPIKQGQKLVVGWLKYEKNIRNAETPLFVKREKKIYGNEKEKIEARDELEEASLSKPINEFPDYSVPETSLPIKEAKENNTVDNAPAKKETPALKKKQFQKTKKETAKSTIAKSKEKKEISQQDKLTNREKVFLNKEKKDEEIVTKKRPGVWSKLKNITRNSYARDKAKEQQQSNTITRGGKIPEKKVVKNDISTKDFKNKVEKKVETPTNQNSPLKENILNIGEIVEERTEPIEPQKPEIVENKMMRLTLLKSINGRISFFYSGKAGAEFYVFTNLAGKNGIIKLTNRANNKFILAKVIGPLPEADRKRGYIVKLSDNTRRVLKVTAKSFSAKVNY